MLVIFRKVVNVAYYDKYSKSVLICNHSHASQVNSSKIAIS